VLINFVEQIHRSNGFSKPPPVVLVYCWLHLVRTATVSHHQLWLFTAGYIEWERLQ